MISALTKKYNDMFWGWLDNRYIIRRVVLGITIWMTYISYTWSASFASSCDKPGLDIAAIIAAVLTPITALQAFIFKLYLDSKGEN
jgi:TRAP-type C4-dicarboxylate transport system permease small subunit